MTRIHRVAQALLIVASLAVPAAAGQQSVTQSDIQRLQDNIYLADRDITTLRSRDSALATQLSTQLDDLRDEVIYLKVKLRKNQTLTRNEYSDVRDRIDQLRNRAGNPSSTAGGFGSSTNTATTNGGFGSGVSTTPATSTRNTATPRGAVEVPSGTEFDVRLQNALDSGT